MTSKNKFSKLDIAVRGDGTLVRINANDCANELEAVATALDYIKDKGIEQARLTFRCGCINIHQESDPALAVVDLVKVNLTVLPVNPVESHLISRIMCPDAGVNISLVFDDAARIVKHTQVGMKIRSDGIELQVSPKEDAATMYQRFSVLKEGQRKGRGG